jgi:PhoPQ-activated pathogenicity-related protein
LDGGVAELKTTGRRCVKTQISRFYDEQLPAKRVMRYRPKNDHDITPQYQNIVPLSGVSGEF